MQSVLFCPARRKYRIGLVQRQTRSRRSSKYPTLKKEVDARGTSARTFSPYAEGVPTGRRKPRGSTRGRSHITENPGLPVENFSVVPVSEHSAIPELNEVLAAQYFHSNTQLLHTVFEYAQLSAEGC